MNKSFLVFAVSLMAIALLATPEMAEPEQKTPVTANVNNQVTISTEKMWVTKRDIRIIQGRERMGNVRLAIDGEAPLEGTFWSVKNIEVNYKIGEYLSHANPMV